MIKAFFIVDFPRFESILLRETAADGFLTRSRFVSFQLEYCT